MRISGGFLEADRVVSCAGHDIISPCATHEEADTCNHAMSHGYHRIILHAVYQLNDWASMKCGWW